MQVNDKLDILHVTSTHRRDDTRIFRKMCVSAARAGFLTGLAAADGLGDACPQGVRVMDVGSTRTRFGRAFFSTFRLARAALKSRARIIHLHDPELIPAGLLLKLCRRRVIYDIHELYRAAFMDVYYLPHPLRKLLSLLYGFAERLAGMCFDACVLSAPHMRKVLPLKRTVLVQNYVREEEFAPVPARAELPRAVCYVGVLYADRGVAEIINAAHAAGVVLFLAGSYYSPALRPRMMQLPGWQCVRELGYIGREQMQQVMHQSAAGLLIMAPRADHAHCSSNKLFEYMAAGIPVIATDLPFAREVIEKHACGMLVPPFDEAALQAAITSLLNDPAAAQAMGARGRAAIAAEYNWFTQEKPLLELYAALGAVAA